MLLCSDAQVAELIEAGLKVGEAFDDDDGFETVLLESLDDFERLGLAGPFFAVVEGGVVGEENLGADLNETVEDSADAAVRADASPNRTEGGSTEQGDESLDVVGHEASNDTVFFHSSSTESIGAPAYLIAELGPCCLRQRIVILRSGDYGDGILVDIGVGWEQEVLGKVQTRTGKEVGPREHGGIRSQDLRALLANTGNGGSVIGWYGRPIQGLNSGAQFRGYTLHRKRT